MTQETSADRPDITLYNAPGGKVEVEVKVDADTVWLNLNQMAELFGRDKSVISRHLRNVFITRELDRKAVVAKNATTAADVALRPQQISCGMLSNMTT